MQELNKEISVEKEAVEDEARTQAETQQEQLRSEQETREQRRKRWEISQAANAQEEQKARRQDAARNPAPNQGTCKHNGFWPKANSSYPCEKCHRNQRYFTFQCPYCYMIACMRWRLALKDGKKRETQGSS
ncbi:hypothetical protein MMC20_003269 [Loxospora ochrophaea]|nr:hypothetical protein [Loxospora ochrophaea]